MDELEKSIKEKIVANKDKFTKDFYLLEYAGIDNNVECSRSICVANDPLLDTLDMSTLASIGQSELDKEDNEVFFEHKYKNIIARLSLISICAYKKQSRISPPSDIHQQSIYNYSKSYVKFIDCVNCNGKKSVNKFDMDVFWDIFANNYNDDYITKFIKNLLEDTLCYEDEYKQNVIVLLIYVVGYCTVNKLQYTNAIREKLKKYLVFAKTSGKYKAKITNDYIIDKYIIKIKKLEIENAPQVYEELIFMNHYFIRYINKTNLDKEVFEDFQSRMQKVLAQLKEEFVIGFLKNVFFKHSVLFGCLSDEQLVRSIIDVYTKIMQKYRTETIQRAIYSFLVLLIQRIPDITLCDILIEKANQIFIGEKYITLQLLSITSLSELQTFLDKYNDSFTSVKQIVEFYYSLLSFISLNEFKLAMKTLNTLCSFLDIHLFIFKEIQSNFLIKFFNKHLKGLITILDLVYRSLLAREEEIQNYVQFNRKYWDILSQVILQIQKYILLFDEEAKKDKKKESRCVFNKTLDSLLAIIYKIEEVLVREGTKEDMIVLKSRSFKISDNKNEQQ